MPRHIKVAAVQMGPNSEGASGEEIQPAAEKEPNR
jgi:hypothetical protein